MYILISTNQSKNKNCHKILEKTKVTQKVHMTAMNLLMSVMKISRQTCTGTYFELIHLCKTMYEQIGQYNCYSTV